MTELETKLAEALQELDQYLPFDWAFDSVPEYAEHYAKEHFRKTVADAREALRQYEQAKAATPAPAPAS